VQINVTENFKQQMVKAVIMIVDDEPINIDVVQAFLEDDGYRNFVKVTEPNKAISAVEEARPDLLLLDLNMPEVSGFDILSEVRSHHKYSHLPVIILTASTDTESKLQALELGATDFLAKPLDQSELALRVRNTLYAKAYQDQLAYYDSLTNLPNRQLFLEELGWSLNVAKRHDEKLALLSIEIDKFSKIKDTIGIGAGDEVLRTIAQRIQSVVRDMDLLGRAMGDDETEMRLFHTDSSVFSLLLNRLQNAESTAYIAERILEKCRQAISHKENEIFVTASIGIATYPAEADQGPALLKLSTSAKDFAKKRGGNCFQFSSESIRENYEQRIKIESLLHKAVQENNFVLHYQPKVDLVTGTILGVEALIRMQTDEGLIYPDDFISLAEETGMIIPIGKWCLHEACHQLQTWCQAGKVPISMSVNLSAQQFTDENFLDVVKEIISTSGIDPAFLTLELTESLLLDDIEQKIKILHDLKEIGVKLSIDDFGTGYSSLSYLRKLPVDELKIDRSFIMEVSDNSDSRAIVSTIIFLADSLDLLTVAEGIEESVEFSFLKEQGCDQYQGYLFSRPIPGDELFKLLPSLD
jgi:diguanylate cyclase (GGDEF)-like protein